MQTKTQSFIEANINTFTGFIVSLLLAYFVLPYYGVVQSVQTSLEITLIFTVVSVGRNYIVRRLFSRGEKCLVTNGI